MIRLLQGPLGALLAALVVLGALWPAAPVLPLYTFDQPFYLGIAHDLRATGRFTDGYMFAEPGPDGARPPGMRFAPLYPALLAAVSLVDPALRTGMDCEALTHGQDHACPRDAPVMRRLQGAMLAAFFVLVWCIGLLATGSRRVAWTTLGLALPTAGVLLRSVDTLMTEVTALLLTTACLAAVLAAWRRHSLPWLAAAGAALGLAILTRPAFLYLLYATIPAGLAQAAAAWTPRSRPAPAADAAALPTPRALRPDEAADPRPGPRALAALAVFVLCASAVVTPWIARNALVVGHAALTRGYDSHTLVQRISFDSMSWREYGLSYLCWLPDGTGLGHLLVGPHACDRFAWDERPDTFYSIGMGPLMQSTLAAAGGWNHHLTYLLTHYILREPLWHAAVTIPLALRAMWIDHYWGLLLGPCCVLLTLHALRGRWRRTRTPAAARPAALHRETRDHATPNHDAAPTKPPRPTGSATAMPPRPSPLAAAPPQPPRLPRRQLPPTDAPWPADGAWQAPFLLLTLPAWFMLAFNAAVAVNQTRYNLMLIPGFALAGALVLDPALRRAAAWPPLRDRLRPRGGAGISSDASAAPRPPGAPWRHPPLAARASGSARSSAALRRRGPRAG
ncbi:MAG: hypothetical protein ACRYG6_14890 [Janthinobacterium lividum]